MAYPSGNVQLAIRMTQQSITSRRDVYRKCRLDSKDLCLRSDGLDISHYPREEPALVERRAIVR